MQHAGHSPRLDAGRHGMVEGTTAVVPVAKCGRHGVRQHRQLLGRETELPTDGRQLCPPARGGGRADHRREQRGFPELGRRLRVGRFQLQARKQVGCGLQRFHHRPLPRHALLRGGQVSERLAQPVLRPELPGCHAAVLEPRGLWNRRDIPGVIGRQAA